MNIILQETKNKTQCALSITDASKNTYNQMTNTILTIYNVKVKNLDP